MRPFTLEIERPIELAMTHELALLRKAVAANPTSAPLVRKLAQLLFIQDQFDELVALLEPLVRDAPTSRIADLLAEAYLSYETPETDRRAERASRQALALAENPVQRARALASLGKALTRQGDEAAARRVLAEALEANPHDPNAYKRLAALDLKSDAFDQTLETAERLMAQGVGHARLLTARTLALVKLGRIAEARETVGLDRFLHRAFLSPPPGWDNIEAFNAEVRAELARHPDLRFNRYGTASTETWRIDQPVSRDSVALPQLQALIRQTVIDYVVRIGAHDAPWTNARPEIGMLHNWCVLTDAPGFEEWHVHQNGWLSGVYYVDVPPAVAEGDGPGGCLAFGVPDDLVGEARAREFGQTLVRPESGMLLMFPSHSYHRTFAHGSDRRRICLAFDIWPG